jgi:hypothetical protein
MKKSLLLIAMLFVLTSMFAVLLNEGFEATTFPPDEWTTAPTAWGRYTTYYYTGTAAAKAGYSTGTWWLMTPKLTPAAGANTLTFWYRDYSSSTAWDYPDEYTYVMVSTTDNQTASFTTTVWTGDYMQFTETWQQATIDLSAYNGQNIYIAFKSVHTGGNYRIIDDVTGVNLASFANDLQAVSLTGNTTPTQGTAASYTLQVRNRGTNDQSAYTVKLMAGTTQLVSQAGPAVTAGSTVDVPLSYTFTTTGPIDIHGVVELASDQDTSNNATAPLSLNVQAAGTVAVTIGVGDQQARMPIDFYWKNSLYECIYLASEINMGGLISGVAFYNNFTSTELAAGKPTKIWLGETTEADLTAAWIPSTQLTQVFDGNVSYPVGQNTITVTFTTPYVYGGGNLVMMVHRPMDTEYFDSTDNFACQTIGTARSRKLQSDSTVFDPANPATATPTGQFPKTTLYFITQGMGSISGTVTSGTTPLEGATVIVEGTQLTTTTSATGTYNFPYVQQGPRQVTCSKIGYTTQTQNVTVVENQTATLNFNMVQLPIINVTGTVVGSDAPTVGLADATVELTGMVDYSATTNAQGQFTIAGVYASNTYGYTVTKSGYTQATGSITVGTTDYSMGTITLNELSYPPTAVQAVEALPNVNITWNAPDPNAVNITESFEADGFPPTDWTQTIVNTDPPNTYGVGGTWTRVGNVALTPAITPPDGSWQCMMWWSYAHQDEWIMTPQFTCPAGATLSFKGYIFLGSPNNDHYYVKVSTDNGTNWTPIWDAVAVGGGAYSDYNTPFVISLAAYAGQQIKIAWHADDPPSADGMWNVAAFDNVIIGSPTRTIVFNENEMEMRSAGAKPTTVIYPRTGTEFLSKAMALGLESSVPVITPNLRNDRSLEGYKVWRLLEGQEANEGTWTLLTQNTITATAYQDMGWSAVPDGMYKWAVKAVYTGNVLSTPALSNAIQKLTQVGTIAGLVRGPNNAIIQGATITVGTATTTSNSTGAYSLQVPAGTHTVTCSATGYQTATQTGVVVVTGQTTNVNFNLTLSNLVTDGFETYTDFSIDFAPWTNVDVDQSGTYGITNTTFLHSEEAMSFIVFNPTTTTPPLTTAAWLAHGGNKFAGCFAATTPPNNDWLISETYTVGTGAKVSFYAKSVTSAYGLERFKVGMSSGSTNPTDFTIVSPGAYVSAPVDWTYYEYNVPANLIGGTVRIGINCVSNDAFVFMLDDYVMDKGAVSSSDPVTPVVATALNGNFPNPFNPETTISYSVKAATPVLVEVYNMKGQKVKTLVNESKATGTYQVKWDGTDDNNQRVTSGVYFYKMQAGDYSSTRKMIMMK